MRRTRRFLLVAFALSLLVHAIVALILHPAHADVQNQTEVVSIVRRPATIAVAKQTHAAASAAADPGAAPRAVRAAPRSRKGSGEAAARAADHGKATPAPTAAAGDRPAGGHANGGCASPNAAGGGRGDAGAADIPAAARAPRHQRRRASVQVQLDATGQVLSASVAQSTGNSSLDLVAVSMAREARYDAAAARLQTDRERVYFQREVRRVVRQAVARRRVNPRP